jgi:aminopeptidase YwaD
MVIEQAAPSDLLAALTLLDPVRMMEHTRQLCAPAFTGRRVGTQGHAGATSFLMEQWQALEWETTTQAFPLSAPVVEQAAPLLLEQVTSEGEVMHTFVQRTEYCEHPRSAFQPEMTEGTVVAFSAKGTIGGYQGAWVALDAVPQGTAFTTLASELAQQGARGLLTPLYANADGYLVKRLIANAPVALPVLSVRADLHAQLVGTRIRARVPVFAHQAQGDNVLAQRPGTDERFANAPLILGAHYDGVGDDVGGPRLPGATDNAAAVAVLLELARVITQFPLQFRRPLLFVAFDAEEVGAQGSSVLASQLKAQGNTPLMLNLDGAACLNDAVWVEPGSQTEPLLQAIDQAGRWLDIPLVVGNIASDQRQFTQAGFPAVGLSVGAAQLHTPGDAIERVQPEALHLIATLLLATLWQLAA